MRTGNGARFPSDGGARPATCSWMKPGEWQEGSALRYHGCVKGGRSLAPHQGETQVAPMNLTGFSNGRWLLSGMLINHHQFNITLPECGV